MLCFCLHYTNYKIFYSFCALFFELVDRTHRATISLHPPLFSQSCSIARSTRESQHSRRRRTPNELVQRHTANATTITRWHGQVVNASMKNDDKWPRAANRQVDDARHEGTRRRRHRGTTSVTNRAGSTTTHRKRHVHVHSREEMTEEFGSRAVLCDGGQRHSQG